MSRENIDDAKLTAPAPKLNPPTPAPKLIGPLRFLLKRPFLSMFTSHSERFIQESNNKYYYSTTDPGIATSKDQRQG